jgi:hypothetical protein
MKMLNYLLVILIAGMLASAGCGKSSKPAGPVRTPGVVDISDVQLAFPAPPPEVASSLDKMRFSLRYRQFDVALVELDKLAHLPNLTEPQKKAIDEAIEQVKQAIALPAKPSQ